MARSLKAGDKLVLEFRDKRLFYTSTKSVEYIGGYPFYTEAKRGTLWLVEVKNSTLESSILSVQILDRNHIGGMPSHQDEIINEITFIQFPWTKVNDIPIETVAPQN